MREDNLINLRSEIKVIKTVTEKMSGGFSNISKNKGGLEEL